MRPRGVRRADVRPGLVVLTLIDIAIHGEVFTTESRPQFPDFSKMLQLFDLIGEVGAHLAHSKFYNHTFQSLAYRKNNDWVAVTLIKDTATPVEVSLWNLGIIPDYVRRPNGDSWNERGWYPLCSTIFDISTVKTGTKRL